MADPAFAPATISKGTVHTCYLTRNVTLQKKYGISGAPEPSSTSPTKTMHEESESKAKGKRKAYQLKKEDTMWQPSFCKPDGQPIKKIDSIMVNSDASPSISHNMWIESDMVTLALMDPDLNDTLSTM